MTASCKKHEAALVSYCRGELSPLKRTRLEAHLKRCLYCAQLEHELSAALAAARSFEPEMPEEAVERLLGRLSPYIEMRQRASFWTWRLVPLAAATAFAALVVLGLYLLPAKAPQPIQELPLAAVSAPPAVETLSRVSRAEVAPGLRLVSGDGFDGKFERRAGERVLRMTRGFAAIALVAGEGRRLRVLTPAAEVEVVGTRFYAGVDSADAATVVQVAEGRVRVVARGQTFVLGPSDSVRATADGKAGRTATDAQIAVVLEDPYLSALSRKPARAAGAGSRPEMLALEDIPAQLDRAEQLVRAGAFEDAAAIYRVCAKDTRPHAQPYRALAAFELGRVLAFHLNDPVEAGRIFDWLAQHATGEVLRQALLTRCEMLRNADACAGLVCLRKLVAEREESDLVAEARKLVSRWQVNAPACATK